MKRSEKYIEMLLNNLKPKETDINERNPNVTKEKNKYLNMNQLLVQIKHVQNFSN